MRDDPIAVIRAVLDARLGELGDERRELDELGDHITESMCRVSAALRALDELPSVAEHRGGRPKAAVLPAAADVTAEAAPKPRKPTPAEQRRFTILDQVRRGPRTVGRIAEELSLPFEGVRSHLGQLVRNGEVREAAGGLFMLAARHPQPVPLSTLPPIAAAVNHDQARTAAGS